MADPRSETEVEDRRKADASWEVILMARELLKQFGLDYFDSLKAARALAGAKLLRESLVND